MEEVVRLKTKDAAIAAVLSLMVVTAQAASPFKKASGDSLLHIPSRVLLPLKVGSFQRVDTDIHGFQERDEITQLSETNTLAIFFGNGTGGHDELQARAAPNQPICLRLLIHTR